jgi:NADP-dependent 3-hydroxy acid dehydrogenase YdfG
VSAVARRRDRIDNLAEKIRGSGGTVIAVRCDVTDQLQVDQAVDRTVAEFGRLDILINNAGVMLLGDVADSPVEEWERMVEVNLLGTMYFVKASLPHLTKAAVDDSVRSVADIVNVSSVAGRTIRHGGAVYSATKHGINAFSESLRQEVTGSHIRIGVVEPGVVATELFSHNRTGILEKIGSRFGAIERLHPGDVAEAICYVITRPRHVSVNELLIRPTEQADKAG